MERERRSKSKIIYLLCISAFAHLSLSYFCIFSFFYIFYKKKRKWRSNLKKRKKNKLFLRVFTLLCITLFISFRFFFFRQFSFFRFFSFLWRADRDSGGLFLCNQSMTFSVTIWPLVFSFLPQNLFNPFEFQNIFFWLVGNNLEDCFFFLSFSLYLYLLLPTSCSVSTHIIFYLYSSTKQAFQLTNFFIGKLLCLSFNSFSLIYLFLCHLLFVHFFWLPHLHISFNLFPA